MSSNSSEFSAAESNRQLPFNPYLLEVGIVILLALATVVINLRMIRDGLNGMTDLRWHIPWIQHFSKQLAEGIWYPRWLASTNFGYGSPTFVFYPPLVYYIGSLLKFSGLDIEQTIITLFSSALFLSGLTFYIYGRNRWGVIASFIGALAYITAPYLAFNIYWVGGLGVIFAQALIPLGWWLTEQAILRPKWRVALAMFWAILALTHTPSLLLCVVVWLPCTLFFLLNRSWKAVVATIVSAGIGLGIASFYLLPATLEQSLVNIDVMKKVGGGFQASMLGTGLPLIPLRLDRHVPHVFVHQSLAIILLALIALVFCRKKVPIIQETWRWLVFAIALAFLMTSWSWPIWQASPTLQRVQAPWRLLQLFSFGGAALCGVVASGILKLRLRRRLFPSLIIMGILLINTSYSYKLSRQFVTIRNPGRGSISHLKEVKIALYEPYSEKLIDVPEYRPVLKNGSPSPAPVIGQPPVSVVSGKADIQLNQWGSYNRIFNVIAEETSTVRVRTYYYPAWHLYVNKKPHPIGRADDGTMELKLEPGSYTVELRYQWTPAFMMGVVLSILSIVALVLLWIKSAKSSVSRQLSSSFDS